MESQAENSNGIRQKFMADAKDIGISAVNRFHTELDARKGTVVSHVQAISSMLENAASGLDENAPGWLRSVLDQGSQQVCKLVDTLEQDDSRHIVDQVNQFARRSPTTFLVLCAAAGFAAGRILKAGSDKDNALPLNEALTSDEAFADRQLPALNERSNVAQADDDGGVL
jgi:hypothetical protein